MKVKEIRIPKRSLGNTNIEVSCLGLGTVKFGRNQNVKYPENFDLPNDKKISDLVKSAEELGLNLLDTAPAYGSSEKRIGELFQKKKISRHNWVISTKVGEEFEDGRSKFDFCATNTELSIKRSLKRLQTDYLDIVLIHSNGFDEEIFDETDCLPTLQRLKKEGLIRAIGVSTKTPGGAIRAAEITDIIMVTLNSETQADLSAIERANELNKGVLIKKVFNSGYADLKEKNLQYALATPGVSSVIIGTLNFDHLQSNVSVARRV
mgnify:FL=1|jgi:aryl-alcohol dehydrogenase-like predicted oxidoreductase